MPSTPPADQNAQPHAPAREATGEASRKRPARFPGAWALRLGFIGLGCALALAILEIGLRLFWRVELASWQRNLDVTVPLDPAVTLGVAGPARIRTNSRGIRGPEWSNNRSSEYRILTLGASDTRCLLQDQPNTWAALLQTRMPATADGRSVWVGNAGGAGYNSRHLVLAMRYMLNQYDPDAVIIMGVTDASMAREEGAACDPLFIDRDEKLRTLARDFAERPASLAVSGRLSLRGTYLWAFLREFRARFRGAGQGMAETAENIRKLQEARRHASRFVDELPDLRPGLEGFRHNLLELIRLAREHDAHLVFMTAPGLLKPEMSREETDRLWAGWIGDRSQNTYWSARAMAVSVDAFNRALLDTCAAEGVDCIDLASRLPSSTAVFWDQAHFTDHGSRLVAAELVEYFQAYFEKTRR